MRVNLSIVSVSCFLVSSCSSTEPAPRSVAGRTFSIISIGGRLLPTNTLTMGRTGCESTVIQLGAITFSGDGSFLWSVTSAAGVVSSISSGYVEPRPGALAIVAAGTAPDTAFVSGDTVRMLYRRGCQSEPLVGVAV